MAEDTKYSPGPWQWTDFGVLSDANGEALLDFEDWQVSPENAVLLAAAPELLGWIARVIAKYEDRLDESDVGSGRQLIRQATDPAYQK